LCWYGSSDFPFPCGAYLEFDPADIPILVALSHSPCPSIIIAVVASAVQELTVSAQSGPYGFVMHVIATSTLVIVSSVIYRIKHTRSGAAVGLLSGTVAMGLIMMLANHFVTPLFLGVPASAVDPILLPIILPFNLIKAGANSIITFFVYKSISKYVIHGEKFGSKDKSAGQSI
jgi:riboflavin transporter FmnP